MLHPSPAHILLMSVQDDGLEQNKARVDDLNRHFSMIDLED